MKNIKWRQNQEALKNNIAKLGIEQLLVHSDSFKSLGFIDFGEDQNQNLARHLSFLSELSSSLVLPVFNYNFPKNRLFDFEHFTSQTGAISDAFKQIQPGKTFDPMFSMSYTSGLESFSRYEKTVNTFESSGVFSKLISSKSGILFYGADINTATIIHYVEAMSSVLYRYDKKFQGKVLIDGSSKDLTYISHFRPMGHYFDYDWKRIKTDLINNALVTSVGKHCHLFNAQQLFNFWCSKMNDDPLYFLDKKSLLWVEPKLHHLGRRFQCRDFESDG